jgi:hypothetical protein
MRRPMAMGVLVVLLAGGCGGSHDRAPAATVARSHVCRVATAHVFSSRFGAGLGAGPVYPVGLGRRAVLKIAPAERFNSRDWGGDKVLWVRRPEIRGTVVVRGRRLDAPGQVRFQTGDVPPDHLDLRATSPDGWTGYPSYTRVRVPGCYAYVVDGPGVHEVIVFRAVRPSTARQP